MSLQGTVTAQTAQGPRLHQEDRHVVHRFSFPDGTCGWLLAVLDGHNGSAAAEVCEEAIPDLFLLRGPEDGRAALARIVAELDRRLRGRRAGTTLSLASILESHARASVAVLGDSPVLILDQSAELWVGPHHNIRTNLEERGEAEGRGGVYDSSGYILNPATGEGLQMGRALGDRGMGDVLSRKPDLHTVELGPGSLVLLATDGVLDLGDEGSARQLAGLSAAWRDGRLREADSLIEWVERRGLWDNATAVVWSAAPAGPGG